MAPKSTFTHCKIPTGPLFESLGNSFLRGMLMACEIDEKLLPKPPQLRGDQLGNKAGYEARRRVTSGVVRGLSRYKFGREAPKLIPTKTGLLPGKHRNRPSGRPSRRYGGPVWRP